MITEKVCERRKNPRARVDQDVYAAFNGGTYKVGLVKDICLDGLAFEYIDDEDADLREGTVDIFASGRKFHIKNIPCRVVYKKPIPRDPITAQIVTFVLARCGIRFDDMDKNQSMELAQVVGAYI